LVGESPPAGMAYIIDKVRGFCVFAEHAALTC